MNRHEYQAYQALKETAEQCKLVVVRRSASPAAAARKYKRHREQVSGVGLLVLFGLAILAAMLYGGLL